MKHLIQIRLLQVVIGEFEARRGRRLAHAQGIAIGPQMAIGPIGIDELFHPALLAGLGRPLRPQASMQIQSFGLFPAGEGDEKAAPVLPHGLGIPQVTRV